MQVTSRGCSRAFILCVLWRGWEYVRSLKLENESVSFPFPESVITSWLELAKEDCLKAENKFLFEYFGGTEFSLDDVTSYWTLPHHFFTW
jgi:hypothetical protein